MYRGAEIQRLYPQPEGPVLWDIDNDPMYIYMYTLPFDPRLFIQTNSDAGVFDEEGVILPFDCAMEKTTGLCVPSAETCELEDITWCVSSPVWSVHGVTSTTAISRHIARVRRISFRSLRSSPLFRRMETLMDSAG